MVIRFGSWFCPLLVVGGALAQQAPAPDALALARQTGHGMLLLQFRATEPNLGKTADGGMRAATAAYQGQRGIPAGHWVWVAPFWFVFRDAPDTPPPARSWGPEAATGAPDTPNAGDCSSAFATLEQDAAGEWLLLEYAQPVTAAALIVHETYNPGAIAAVTVFRRDGSEVEVWRNRTPGPIAEGRRELRIDLPLGFRPDRIRLHLASDLVGGWNEIDAVGLEDVRGKVHWASRAQASTTYAEQGAAGMGAQAGLGGAAQIPFVIQPLQVQVQPVLLQPVQIELPELKLPEMKQAEIQLPLRFQPFVIPPVQPQPVQTHEAEIAELRAKIADLEARLERARAGKQ